MDIFLIRHGEKVKPLAKGDNLCFDEGLTKLGHEQAKRAALWVKEFVKPEIIYSSTMVRARETAAHFEKVIDCSFFYDNRLREIGTCYPDSRPIPPEEFPLKWNGNLTMENIDLPICLGAESWKEFLKRIKEFLGELRSKRGGKICIIAHGGTFEGILTTLLKIDTTTVWEAAFHNTSITHLELCADDLSKVILHKLNACPHFEQSGKEEYLTGARCLV